MTLTTFLIGLLAIILIYGILIYNNFISLRNTVAKNWANIDVLLKQRNSELPKLIETCKEYMSYEQDTLLKVVEARSASLKATELKDIAAIGIAESDLHKSLAKLFALAENYPDLKTNRSFMQLQQRISDLENAIADRREFFNDSVNLYNIRIQQFPDVIVAKMMSFKPAELLKFQAKELEDVHFNDLFQKKS